MMNPKKIFSLVFPMFFLGIGLFVLIKVSLPFALTWYEEQSNVEVKATLKETNLDWSANEYGQYVYTLSADYEYDYNGETYIHRKEETDVRDSSYHEMNVRNNETILEQWEKKPEKVLYINPESPGKPQESQALEFPFVILMMLLPAIFVLSGLFMIIRAVIPKRAGEAAHKEPWLKNAKWKKNHIACNTVTKNRSLIFFAVFWNLIAFTIFSIFLKEEGYESEAIWLVGIFPSIGLILIFAILSKVVDLAKNGSAYLVLDPFPGSIGGHLGGIIYFKKAFPKNSTIELKVNCTSVRYERSGKNRRRVENLLWQATGFAYLNNDSHSAQFRFDIPADKHESSLSSTGIHWNIMGTVSYDDYHFNRQFEIPMYKTEELSSIEQDSKNHPETKRFAFELINDVTEFTENGNEYTLRFPNFRILRLLLVFGLILGGGMLALSGYSLTDDEWPMALTIVLGFFGLIVFGLAVFESFYTLKVSLTPEKMVVQYKWMGFAFKMKSLSKEEIKDFKIGDYLQSGGSNSSPTSYHKISAVFGNDEKTTVAIRLKNRATAEQMKGFFDKYYKMKT